MHKTPIEGCYIFEPKVYTDSRGLFYESYNKQTFENLLGREVNFVQDNESLSSKGVLRGLHFQMGDYAQAKLVRVINGSVQDVVVDLRPNSRTFRKYMSVILSKENKKQLFIPKGLAHGFLVLEDNTIFNYKCDNFYYKDSESGIRFDDPDLNIDWKLKTNEIILSDKDKELPTYTDSGL